jgi:hypothetical protein
MTTMLSLDIVIKRLSFLMPDKKGIIVNNGTGKNNFVRFTTQEQIL